MRQCCELGDQIRWQTDWHGRLGTGGCFRDLACVGFAGLLGQIDALRRIVQVLTPKPQVIVVLAVVVDRSDRICASQAFELAGELSHECLCGGITIGNDVMHDQQQSVLIRCQLGNVDPYQRRARQIEWLSCQCRHKCAPLLFARCRIRAFERMRLNLKRDGCL